MTKPLIDPETSAHLNLLRNHIDIKKVPFSDRGSRILVLLDQESPSFYIKLAERLTTIQPDIEAYLLRPPFIQDLVLLDEEGDALDFTVTTYPHIVNLQTAAGNFDLVFQDHKTLAIGLPPRARTGIRFHVQPQFWETTDGGGLFKGIRNLFYTSTCETIRNEITPDKGGYTVEYIVQAGGDSAITLTISDDQQVMPQPQALSLTSANAEERWRKWFAAVPQVSEKYRATYAYAWWIMANNLIGPQGQIAYEAMMPSKITYVGLWLWDSAMHTLAYRHVDPDLARNQIRAMLACQLDDGMLPDAIYDEGIISTIDHPISSEVTKPPILAWAALKLHEMDPDPDFLQEIYIPLVRWNAWWFAMNDDDVDGLAQYNHPYSSGLDDNPLWDQGMPVESPDLNTYLCVQMGSLATIAEILGIEFEAQMWRRRASAIVHRMLKDMWDEESGLFRALHHEQPVQVTTPFNLFPLWTGQLPDEVRERLLIHLTNPAEFWGDFALPSVAYNDPKFDPQTMWRGPVWVNINYFFVEALRQIGEVELAHALRAKTLELICRHDSIFEYYNALNGEPPPTAADVFGWTAAVFIDLAIQDSREPREETEPEE
ncbi:MAG: trehalase family glycosidase [Candidatus Promineifilaceae bacterium]|nr:trehalase family glycosidase [Candidatus Promineifilaceae bacterium]